MKKGLFISMEGPDGSGKSTQIACIKAHLEQQGIDVYITREPGGTPIGEQIRGILLDRQNGDMADMTEAMLYAASRAQLVRQVISPALAAGTCVICDRYVDSSVAYQGCGRHLGDSVEVINRYAVDGVMPDVTFLMKVDPRVGKQRQQFKDKDRLEMESESFHEAVFRGYLELEKKYPERIMSIDASRSVEEISSEILSRIDSLLAAES